MKSIRLLLLTIIIHQLSINNCHAQAGEWTWVAGDSSVNSYGQYGVQGVPSPANSPAARYACGYWTDTAGNFWIYGGLVANFVSLDDLWKFNPQTAEWTWMKGDTAGYAYMVVNANRGVYNALNSPGTLKYGMFTWVTADNHLWLYSGYNSANLWQFDPAINQWAWMGDFDTLNYGTKGVPGATNHPGVRFEGNCAWTDSAGNLWLFGGNTNDTLVYNENAMLNDMWEYNVSTGMWAWMGGSSTPEDTGSYGPIGQPSANYYPSSRNCNLFWKDDEGLFWLVGGTIFPLAYMYQDIWNFNPKTLEWTLVAGHAGTDTFINRNTCTADTINRGGPRYENRVSWKICDKLVITYSGISIWHNQHEVNDMSAYQVGRNQWIKVNEWGIAGNYGTLGVTSPANYPPERCGSVGFKDRNNNLWMFSGLYNSETYYYNDMWKYVLDTTCVGSLSCNFSCDLVPPALTGGGKICTNDSIQLCSPAGFDLYHWNNGNTNTCLETSQTGNYYVAVTDINGCTALSDTIALAVYPVPVDSVVANAGTICFGDTAQLCALPGFRSYRWSTTDTTGCIPATQPGTYYVIVTDSNGCTRGPDSAAIAVYPVPVDSVYTRNNIFCPGDSTQLCAEGSFFTYRWNTGDTGSCVYATQAGDYYVTITDENGCTGLSNQLAVFVYPVPSVSIEVHGDTLSSFGQVSYQWLLSSEPLPADTGTVCIARQPGLYSVQVKDTNGCTAVSQTVLVTGISGLPDDGWDVNIFPNPSVGNWQLAAGHGLLGSSLEVYDDEGRLVFQSAIRDLKSEIALDVASGVYYLRISNDRLNIIKKLIKL